MVSLSIINITTVIFGLAALLLATKARSRLSKGSIRDYIDNFSICLGFIVLFSSWQAIRSIYSFEWSLGEFADYPEILFLLLAYSGFIFASYKVLKISEEFGFKVDGKSIDKLIKKASKKKKKNK